jgi:hypothetical protein
MANQKILAITQQIQKDLAAKVKLKMDQIKEKKEEEEKKKN